MITVKQIASLKKTNAGIDSQKTKTRITEDFKATSRQDKEAILGLSGLSNTAFYNAGKTGNHSPKVVISLAQTLNVSPYYYTGEIDEKEAASESVMKGFLRKYKNKIPDAKTKKSVDIKKDISPVDETAMAATEQGENPKITLPNPIDIVAVDEREFLPEATSTTAISMDFDNSPKMKKAVEELSEEAATLLLKALMERAKAGGNAEVMCDIVKRCLLS